ncbi:MAG: protein-L-isoaspartate(D-aspartate) O-methyltransferase [Opitutales bacterium]|jgi:protein-L-isoaspartate(D-aspartate) O-methyltransferase
MGWGYHGPDDGEEYGDRRRLMVARHLVSRGIKDPEVLKAMSLVPREAFVPNSLKEMAYADGPLPIGAEQTISQPYVVAAMSEALSLGPQARVLEIGTGSGYQTAVLAAMGLTVYTIERIDSLGRKAAEVLRGLGFRNVRARCGDGTLGWPEEAPFDGIIVTAAADQLPMPLVDQLGEGGRLVIPVGVFDQDLRVYQKNKYGEISCRSLFPVRFVPLVGGES